MVPESPPEPVDFRISVGESNGDYYEYYSCTRSTYNNPTKDGKKLPVQKSDSGWTADYVCQPSVAGDPIGIKRRKYLDTSNCGGWFQRDCHSGDYKFSGEWTVTFPQSERGAHGIASLTFVSQFPNLFANN